MHLPRLMLTPALFATLAAVPSLVHADKLDGLDDTMQVLEEAADIDKASAYFDVPAADNVGEDPDSDAADAAAEITDPADFDDDFEHDVELEEELMEHEDDFEDGDDVDDDRIGTASGLVQ